MSTHTEAQKRHRRTWWGTYGGVVAGTLLVTLGHLLSLPMRPYLMLIGAVAVVGFVYDWNKRRRIAASAAIR